MTLNDLALHAAVIWGANLGPAGFRKLIETFGSLHEAASATTFALKAADSRLSDAQIRMIQSAPERLEETAELLHSLHDEDITVATVGHEQYPRALNILRNPPPLITLRGKFTDADMQSVAMVGTRSPSREGCERAAEIADISVECGLTVVSGLAAGIDTASHEGALVASGRTMAVLGSGIRHIYPPGNRQLAAAIEDDGVIMSELSPDSEPEVGTLMARNRLIAALACGTIVVSSGATGGTMVTAEHTIGQGKPLAAVDWEDGTSKGAGNVQLIADGAAPLTTADSVREFCSRLQPVMSRPDIADSAEPDDQMQLF
ncbi:MAG: DNA-processing protein DprA [Armatimonadota bacterium]